MKIVFEKGEIVFERWENREGFGGVDECLDSGCNYLITSLGTISLFVKSQLGRRERGEARLD